MSITQATILAFVNNRLQEDFADNEIDDAILACLNDLTKFNLLTKSSPDSQSGVDGDTTLDVPSDFKKLISITPTDGSSVRQRPLIAVPGGFKEYRLWNSNSNTNFRSTPTHYTRLAGSFYLYPTLNGSFTFEIEYYKTHEQSTDTIEFDDNFANAINFGSTYYAALFRKKVSYVNIWRGIYQEERALMIRLNPPEPSFIGA